MATVTHRVPAALFRLVSNRSILVLPTPRNVPSFERAIGVGRNSAGYLVDSVPFVTGLALDRVRGPVLSRRRVESCREILRRLTIVIALDRCVPWVDKPVAERSRKCSSIHKCQTGARRDRLSIRAIETRATTGLCNLSALLFPIFRSIESGSSSFLAPTIHQEFTRVSAQIPRRILIFLIPEVHPILLPRSIILDISPAENPPKISSIASSILSLRPFALARTYVYASLCPRLAISPLGNGAHCRRRERTIGSIIRKGINDFLIASIRPGPPRARWLDAGGGGKRLLSGRFIAQLAPFIRPRGRNINPEKAAHNRTTGLTTTIPESA